MKVFFYALFFHLTLNLYVFWRGRQTLATQKGLRRAFTSVFVIEFLVYLTGLLLQRHLPADVLRVIAFIGTSWMLFLLYMTLLLLVMDVVWWIHRRKPFLFGYVDRRPKKTRAIVFSFMSLAVVVVLWLGNVKFNHPSIVHHEISIDKKAHGIHSLRIAMIGDTHLGYLINKPFAKKYVDLIMAQKPDLILFVGDIIDAEMKPLTDENMGEEIRRLHAPMGVFTCTGNHEYRYDAEKKIKWLNDNGIAVLRDAAVLIDSAFYIVGREDVTAPFARKPIQEIINTRHIDTSKPIIVLNHNPHFMEEDVDAGVDVALYGHTHRGQFFPANLVTDFLFEVSHGYKKSGNTHVYVTSGLGLAGPQYRIGTQSEVVVLTVKFGA